MKQFLASANLQAGSAFVKPAPAPYRRRFLLSFAAIYILCTVSVFLVLVIAGVLSSSVVGFGLVYLLESFSDWLRTTAGVSLESGLKNITGIILVAGVLGSGLMFVFVIRAAVVMFAGYYVATPLLNLDVTKAVKDVVQKVGVAPFAGISLEFRASAFRTLYAGFGRYVVLSALALKYLTENEFKAIVAHECAHHHNNAMLLNRLHFRNEMILNGFYQALSTSSATIDKWQKKGWGSNLLGTVNITLFPFMFALIGYRWFLNFVGELIVDSEYEYYCDSVAIELVGGATVASALKKIVALQIAADQVQPENAVASMPTDRTLAAIDLRFGFQPDRLLSLYIEGQKQTRSKTHPPLTERLRRAMDSPSLPDESVPLLSRSEADVLCKSLRWKAG